MERYDGTVHYFRNTQIHKGVPMSNHWKALVNSTTLINAYFSSLVMALILKSFPQRQKAILSIRKESIEQRRVETVHDYLNKNIPSNTQKWYTSMVCYISNYFLLAYRDGQQRRISIPDKLMMNPVFQKRDHKVYKPADGCHICISLLQH